jgi:parallel beta-helix repeat protein
MKSRLLRRTQSTSTIAIAGSAATLTMTSGALAGSLYVAVSGSDSNPGTLSSPLRTINRAASLAGPGTDIIVRGGTYSGPVWIGNSGTAAAYITVHPYPGESVIIDGTGIPRGQDLVGIGGNYVEFRGFEVRNNSGGVGISAWCQHNDNIINNVVHNIYSAGIYAGCNSFGSAHDDLIQGNIVFNASTKNSSLTAPGWNQGITAQLNDNTVISQNKVYKNYGEGIGAAQSRGTVISGNAVFDNYSVEIYLDNAPGTIVNGNFIYNDGNSSFLKSGQYQAVSIGAAIESYSIQLPLTGIRITNNITYGGEYGFYYGNYGTGGGMQNAVVANNTFVYTQRETVHIDPDNHSGDVYMNNIHYASMIGLLSYGSTAGWAFNYNNWYGGSVSSGFAGANDVRANPALVNPWSYDPNGFKIAATSPDATAGATLSASLVDFWGTMHTPPYSIGAHQNSGS